MIKRFFSLLLLLSLMSSCMVYKTVRYWLPGIDEYHAFPQAKISSGEEKFHFPVAIDSFIVNMNLIQNVGRGDTLRPTVDEYLAKSATTAFLLIKNDTIVYEQYFTQYEGWSSF